MLTFLRQPWQIAGLARQACRTNWLCGIDGGNQNKRHFSRCPFFNMFGRKNQGLVVFQSKWFVLAQQLWCLVFALLLLVSEQKHFPYTFANDSKYIASCLDWRSGVPATLHVLCAGGRVGCNPWTNPEISGNASNFGLLHTIQHAIQLFRCSTVKDGEGSFHLKRLIFCSVYLWHVRTTPTVYQGHQPVYQACLNHARMTCRDQLFDRFWWQAALLHRPFWTIERPG